MQWKKSELNLVRAEIAITKSAWLGNNDDTLAFVCARSIFVEMEKHARREEKEEKHLLGQLMNRPFDSLRALPEILLLLF